MPNQAIISLPIRQCNHSLHLSGYFTYHPVWFSSGGQEGEANTNLPSLLARSEISPAIFWISIRIKIRSTQWIQELKPTSHLICTSVNLEWDSGSQWKDPAFP